MNVGDVIFAVLTLMAWGFYIWVDRYDPWPWYTNAGWAAFWGLLALTNVVLAPNLTRLTTVADGATSAWLAYTAWKRRPPRKRKLSKVSGLVRDLGHRLTAVPE